MKWLERFWFGCGHCHGTDGCPWVQDGIAPDENAGGARLVLLSMVVFLLPLLTAMVGAYYVGAWQAGAGTVALGWWQALGAVIGFAAGIPIARLLVAVIRRINPWVAVATFAGLGLLGAATWRGYARRRGAQR